MRYKDYSKNLNPLGPPKTIARALNHCNRYLTDYPDDNNESINRELANFFELPIENISFSNGTTEALYALPQIENAKFPIIVEPTYVGFKDALKILGIEFSSFVLEDSFEYNYEMFDWYASKATMLYFCNPNNPTFASFSKNEILTLITNHQNCHFIVDESHLLFNEDFKEQSILSEVTRYNNLSVVHSFSKFFALPGLRVGSLISNNKTISLFKKWKPPCSTSIVSHILFGLCLKNKRYIEETRSIVAILVSDLYNQLLEIEWLQPVKGKTSFVMCMLTNGYTSKYVTESLQSRGYLVRNIKDAYPHLHGEWIRISSGSNEQNSELVGVMKTIRNEKIINGA